MSNTAIIANWFYIPVSLLNKQQMADIRRDLTIIPSTMPIYNRFNEVITKENEPIKFYTTGYKGYIGVPINYGLNKFPDIKYKDLTTQGTEIKNDPIKKPEYRAGQKEYIDSLEKLFKTRYTVQAKADTGTGKTICGLSLAVRLKRKTLIVVPKQMLADQWIAEIKDKFCYTDNDIGFIGDGKFSTKGKKFVVGIVNSLAMKDIDVKILNSFGFVIYDESHKYGSRRFCKVLTMFKAAYKLAQSATPDRRDDTNKIIRYYMGPVQATMQAPKLKAKLYKLYFESFESSKGVFTSNRNAVLDFLIKDKRRNAVAVRLVKYLISLDRNALFITDRINHIENIINLCVANGVDKELLGQFTGSKSIKAGSRKKLNQDRDFLDHTLKTKKILFSTPQMMTEGISENRLDFLVDLTPRSDSSQFEQLIGRIERLSDGKKEPIVLSFIDNIFPSAERRYCEKIKGLLTRGYTEHVFTKKGIH
jgi:superfamily II DNA or RNA helicase